MSKLKALKSKKVAMQGEPVKIQTRQGHLESAIRQTIIVIDELRDLIPPLQTEERQQLRDNIAEQGIREPILLWKEGEKHIIIDGHNRYSIAQELSLTDFPVKVVEGLKDLTEVKDWMILNQLGRRNLTPMQASFLRGQLYNATKKDRTQNLNRGEATPKDQIDTSENQAKGSAENSTKDQIDTSGKTTSKRIADDLGVGEATIKRDGKFAQGLEKIGLVSPEVKKQILSGEAKVRKADIEELASAEESNLIIEKATDIKREALKMKAKPEKAKTDISLADGLWRASFAKGKFIHADNISVAGVKVDAVQYVKTQNGHLLVGAQLVDSPKAFKKKRKNLDKALPAFDHFLFVSPKEFGESITEEFEQPEGELGQFGFALLDEKGKWQPAVATPSLSPQSEEKLNLSLQLLESKAR